MKRFSIGFLVIFIHISPSNLIILSNFVHSQKLLFQNRRFTVINLFCQLGNIKQGINQNEMTFVPSRIHGPQAY